MWGHFIEWTKAWCMQSVNSNAIGSNRQKPFNSSLLHSRFSRIVCITPYFLYLSQCASFFRVNHFFCLITNSIDKMVYSRYRQIHTGDNCWNMGCNKTECQLPLPYVYLNSISETRSIVPTFLYITVMFFYPELLKLVKSLNLWIYSQPTQTQTP